MYINLAILDLEFKGDGEKVRKVEKCKSIFIRVTPAEKESMEREAYAEGISLSEYVLDAHKVKLSQKGKCPCCGQEVKKK